jgi:hypothetical protein
MSKRLILVLAVLLGIGLCGTTYAAVQNVKVSGDITLTGAVRNHLSLEDWETCSTPDFEDNTSAMLSQVRVRVDADLTDNVSTTVRLLNERTWGDEADYSNNTSRINNSDVSVDLAYVTLKEFLYSPLTLTLGRQELRFGNGLIIGDPDTNGIADGHGTTTRYLPNSLDDLSKRKAFDAIRATLDYNPLVVDLVYAKIDEQQVDIDNDVNFYGVNAAYAVNKDLNTEGYYFQRTREPGYLSVATATDEPENTRVVGARGVYTGIENMLLGLEGAYQFGNHVSRVATYPDDIAARAGQSSKVNAYAIQSIMQYAFPKVKYEPVARFAYTYLSGEKYLNQGDNYRGWNPMFEDQAGGTLYNKILGFSNAQLFNLCGIVKPMEDVTAKLDYTYLRLNQPYTAVATGVILSGVASDPAYKMTNAKSLGHEIDLLLTYDYTEDVQFALNTGAFIPGEAFTHDNDNTATQVIGSMKVTF